MDNDIFNNLRVLNLEGNPIEYWEEVNKLGQLPKYIFYTFFFVNYLILMEIYLIFSLEQLSLYGCGLKNIQVKEKSFSKLSKLSLSNNKISQVYIIYF
jgi:Leucine-rich repeat (LRR) protein